MSWSSSESWMARKKRTSTGLAAQLLCKLLCKPLTPPCPHRPRLAIACNKRQRKSLRPSTKMRPNAPCCTESTEIELRCKADFYEITMTVEETLYLCLDDKLEHFH